MSFLRAQGPFEVHYCQPQPRFRPVAAHALEREQPDVAAPRFSRCTMPVVFWPYWWETWTRLSVTAVGDCACASAAHKSRVHRVSRVRRHTNVYEVVSEAIEPLWRMMPGGDGWPLLLDRRAKLVPGIDGYPMPDFYHWLLLPFSHRKVSN
jgi:hypothetical protein